jgi:hypothetical protein
VIEFAQVSVGTGGGLRCSRCGLERAPETSYRPAADITAEVREVVAAWSRGAGPNVALGGPEPFGHPELPGVVSAALEAGVARLRLDTDAGELRDPGVAAGAIGAGVRHVRIALLGGTPGVHDALADAPGALEATLAGAATYVSVALSEGVTVALSALVPVCRHNIRDVPAAVGRAMEAGASHVTLRVDDGGIDLAAALPWLTAAADTGVVNRVWVELEGVPPCMLPEHALHAVAVTRASVGTNAPACADCSLDPWCPGGPPDASAELLGRLAPPPYADTLAAGIAKVRAGEAL